MIDAASEVVPPDSSVTDVIDNQGWSILVGDYRAHIYFGDGGLAPDALLGAVADRAAQRGWAERYRCDLQGGVKVGYSRDSLKIDVSVLNAGEERSFDGIVRVQRLGDGNEWPPSDC